MSQGSQKCERCKSGNIANRQEYWKSVSAAQQGNAYMSCKHRNKLEGIKVQELYYKQWTGLGLVNICVQDA